MFLMRISKPWKYCRIDLMVSLAASVYSGLPILIAPPKEIGVVVLELRGVPSVKTSYQHLHGRGDAPLLVVMDHFVLGTLVARLWFPTEDIKFKLFHND
jgi:hypothetical protein